VAPTETLSAFRSVQFTQYSIEEGRIEYKPSSGPEKSLHSSSQSRVRVPDSCRVRDSAWYFDGTPAKFGSFARLPSRKVWISPQPCVVSQWQGRRKPYRGPKLRWLLAGRAARPCRSSYSEYRRYPSGANDGDRTSWAHLLLHSCLVGRTFGFGKEIITKVR
jgi:hypothetical protein